MVFNVVLLLQSVANCSFVTKVPLFRGKGTGNTFLSRAKLSGMDRTRGRGGHGGHFGGYKGRYAVLGYDSDGEGGEWLSQDGKRRRRSTGGTFNYTGDYVEAINKPPDVTTHKFKAMSTDETLVTLFELMNNVSSINARVTSTERNIENVNKHLSSHERRLLLLEYKSIDLEVRNRRNNLIFRGIDETNFAADEDCASLVKDFLYDHVDPQIVPVIQRAHRLGNPSNLQNINRRRRSRGQPPTTRPIIACFRDSADVEAILNNANKLKDKPKFGINKDYPTEITQARTQLWPLYKSEREKNPNSKVYIGFPAKLVVGGQVKKDLFPNWHTILRGSRRNTDDQDMYHPSDRDLDKERHPEPMQIATSSQQNDITETIDDQQSVVANPATELNMPSEESEPTSKSDPATSPYDEAMIRLLDHVARLPQSQSGRQKEETGPTRQRASSVPRLRGTDQGNSEILRAPKFQPSQK